MSIIGRALAHWFPSVPPGDQARILAAMEGRSQIPVSTSLGEDGVETGPAPAAVAPGGPDPVETGPAPLAAAGPSVVTQPVTGGGIGPEDGTGSRAASASALFSGPPAVETDLFWEPSADAEFDVSDARLAHLLRRWGQS